MDAKVLIAVNSAISFEAMTYDFNRIFAAGIDNKSAKDFLMRLAIQELRHERLLEDFLSVGNFE